MAKISYIALAGSSQTKDTYAVQGYVVPRCLEELHRNGQEGWKKILCLLNYYENGISYHLES